MRPSGEAPSGTTSPALDPGTAVDSARASSPAGRARQNDRGAATVTGPGGVLPFLPGDNPGCARPGGPGAAERPVPPLARPAA